MGDGINQNVTTETPRDCENCGTEVPPSPLGVRRRCHDCAGEGMKP